MTIEKPVLFELRPDMTDDELQAITEQINEGQAAHVLMLPRLRP